MRNFVKRLAGLTGLMFVAMCAQVHAAVPAAVSAAFTELETDAGTYVASALAVSLVFVLGWLGIKMLKKVISKAT